MKIVFACLVISSLFLSGCYYDSVEKLYPPCDTTNVTYTKSIKPILRASCFDCHGETSYSSVSNYNLEDTTELKRQVTNGNLFRSITHQGSKPMPQGRPKLDDCKIATFKKWIEAGAICKY